MDSLAGQQVGPYKLITRLGRGGMGVVFLAERADDQYRKRVAIKLVRRDMDAESILSRFRSERQILASLDHPNICRLLDGGTSADGLPYFVMEVITAADGSVRNTITPETVSRTREGQPQKLRKRLAGDLDNIVLMALRKEPRRRYASVEHLAEDLRRHLEGLPVSARKDTVGYRTGKFIRRNKLAVAAGAAFLALVIGFGVTAQIQAVRVKRERDKAQQVTQFLTDLFRVADPGESRGNTVTAREILDRGAEKLERQLSGEPEVRATLLDTVGNVYSSLGLYDAAARLLRQALTLRQQALGPEAPEVAASLSSLGDLLRIKGDYAEAEPMLREALAITHKIGGKETPEVASVLNNLGLLFNDKGDFATSESYLRQSLAMRRKFLGEENVAVAGSLTNLAEVLHAKGDYANAESLLRQSIAIHRHLAEAVRQ